MINTDFRLVKKELPHMGVDAFSILMAITSFLGHANDVAWPGADTLREMCPTMDADGNLKPMSVKRFYLAVKTLKKLNMIKSWQVNVKGEFGGMRYRVTTEYLGIYVKASQYTLTDPDDGREEHEISQQEEQKGGGEPFGQYQPNGVEPFGQYPLNAKPLNAKPLNAKRPNINNYQKGSNYQNESNYQNGNGPNPKNENGRQFGDSDQPAHPGSPPHVAANPPQPPRPMHKPMADDYMQATEFFWAWIIELGYLHMIKQGAGVDYPDDVMKGLCRQYFTNLQHQQKLNLIWNPCDLSNVAGLEQWVARHKRFADNSKQAPDRAGNNAPRGTISGDYDAEGNYIGKTLNTQA